MSPEIQAPDWAWYYIALYFFIAGTAAGAYFIGSLEVLFGGEKQHEISRPAYYLAFPLLTVLPIPLIADLGRPERFWHLFFYLKGGYPYINLQSPMSVGSWCLLLFSGFALLSFIDNLIADRYLTWVPFSTVYNRVPRRVYALFGSLTGFFVAGYTGVLLNVTAQPFWAAAAPFLGPLFIVSGASTGAAAIALFMLWRKSSTHATMAKLERFDRVVMVAELVLVALTLSFAGKYAAALFAGTYLVLFWGGAVFAGIVLPLSLGLLSRRSGASPGQVLVTSILALIGGALLRICLLQAGQV
jgi:formate-dependent nitrite reductase membrane component NrfD